jgi:asparagine synthase (glutamine-hydrolysing)
MAELGMRRVGGDAGLAEFRGRAARRGAVGGRGRRSPRRRHVVRTVDRAEFERDCRILDAMDLPTTDGINTVRRQGRARAGIKVARAVWGPTNAWAATRLRRRRAACTCCVRFRFCRRRRSPGACCRPIAAGLGLHPKAAGLLQYGGSWAGAHLLRRQRLLPWELDELLDPVLLDEGLRRLAPLSRIAAELQAGGSLGDFDRVAALETSLYMRNQLLRDADWAGMAHSVEIRVPYVDPFFLAVLPPGKVLSAADAKRAVADIRSRPCRRRVATGPRPASSRGRRWIGDGAGAAHDVNFSVASRAWALRVWQAGWTGPVAA